MRFFNIHAVLFILIFSACNLNNVEDPSESKKVIMTFNEDWYFMVDENSTGEESGWFSKQNIPVNAIGITVPHTWNVMDEYQDYYGKGWYFKTFEVPEDWNDKIIKLKFSAIYRDARIWLNDQLILERVGAGYTPFEVNIEPFLRYNEQNYLAIEVSNHFSKYAIPFERKFDWPADGGIIRNVYLVKNEIPAIDYIYIEPRYLRQNNALVSIEMGIEGHDRLNIKEIDVWYIVSDKKQGSQNILLEGNKKAEIKNNRITFDLNLEKINPWHFWDPNLYEIKIAIGYKSILTDHISESFGFRTITVSDDKLIFNGEPVRLPGLEWMPGSNPVMGMAEDSSNMKRMLNLLKGTNAVLTRFHWQQDDYILDWCDKNGILVQEEIPLWQAPYPDQINDTIMEIIDRHLEEMIHAHRNHPSIISWGIGNELAAQDPRVKDLLKYLYTRIQSIDSLKLINYVSNTFHQDPEKDGTDIGDVLMWNDYSGLWYDLGENGFPKERMPGFLGKVNSILPEKPLIISEYGLCEPFFKGGDERRIELMKYHTLEYDNRSFIAGNIYFSLNDYRTHMGEGGTGKYKQRVHGLTDLEGIPKPSYWVLYDLFSPIRELKGEWIGQRFYVTGRNHDGLPSYTLRGFKIILLNDSRDQLARKNIPDVFPGNKFNVVFNNISDNISEIHIISSQAKKISQLQIK